MGFFFLNMARQAFHDAVDFPCAKKLARRSDGWWRLKFGWRFLWRHGGAFSQGPIVEEGLRINDLMFDVRGFFIFLVENIGDCHAIYFYIDVFI